MYKKMIRLDLELEQPKTNPQTLDSGLDYAKIIQVGWCVFEAHDGKIELFEKRSVFIDIGTPLSNFIKKLTGISNEDLKGGLTLLEAYNLLKEDQRKYSTSRIVRQWGNGDMEELKAELESETPNNLLTDYSWGFGRSGFNVKHLFQAYCLANGLNERSGLAKSLRRVGLNFESVNNKGKHDALADAVNTARMYAFLENKLENE
jgi:inhibitor of KinA sporulation pathway (predicted exonuclease)